MYAGDTRRDIRGQVVNGPSDCVALHGMQALLQSWGEGRLWRRLGLLSLLGMVRMYVALDCRRGTFLGIEKEWGIVGRLAMMVKMIIRDKDCESYHSSEVRRGNLLISGGSGVRSSILGWGE